jgi:hypothetical protein
MSNATFLIDELKKAGSRDPARQTALKDLGEIKGSNVQ